jgi:hypothetical protein
MATETDVESDLGRIMSKLSQFLNPVEISKILDAKGSSVTVVSTHAGRTSLNTKELYNSDAVQQFIRNASETPLEPSGSKK